MKTDWSTVREMMAAAIDTCEQLESMGYGEHHRDRTVDVSGTVCTVHEFLVSSWTFPENVRYEIIRDRHRKGVDLPYVPEAARIINAMAGACGELVGASDAKPAQQSVRRMIDWYATHAIPRLRRALP